MLDTGFTFKGDDEEVADFVKKHELYHKNKITINGNVRPMEKKDIPGVFKLFNMQQQGSVIKYKMSQEDLAHNLLYHD